MSYRLTKFVRRNTVGVAAASLAVLALVGGLAGALWQARIAREERARSDRRFAEVRTLATSFLFDINDAIENLPGATPARALLVSRALESLDGLANEAPGDPSLQRDLAQAYIRVGSVQGNSSNSNLGDTPGALRSYRRAVALLEAIPPAHANDTGVPQAKWQAYEGLANMLNIVGDLPAAITSFERARDVLRAMVAAAPDSVHHVRMLAMVYRELGDTRGADGQASVGDTRGAFADLRQSVALNEGLLRRLPSDVQVRSTLATSLMSLGALSISVGDTLGTSQLQRAVTLLEQVVREQPQNAFARHELLSAYSRLRQPWADAARYADALAIDRKIIAVLDTMIAGDPANVLYRRNRGVMLNWTGRDLRAAGQGSAAVPYHRLALQVAQQQQAADPQSLENRQDVTVTWLFLGEALADAGSARTALEAFERARADAESLRTDEPSNPRHEADLAMIHTGRGRVLEALGAHAAADSAFATAVPLAEATATDTLNQKGQSNLALVYATVGDALRRRGGACAVWAGWQARSVTVWRRMERRGALLPRYRPRLVASETAVAACPRRNDDGPRTEVQGPS